MEVTFGRNVVTCVCVCERSAFRLIANLLSFIVHESRRDEEEAEETRWEGRGRKRESKVPQEN